MKRLTPRIECKKKQDRNKKHMTKANKRNISVDSNEDNRQLL